MKKIRLSTVLALLATSLTVLLSLRADDTAKPASEAKQKVNVCIVSGEHLQPGDTVTYVYKEDGQPDRTIRLCCRKCLARFKANPETYLKKLDQLEADKPVSDQEPASP